MSELTLDHFLGAVHDYESAQYRILDRLQHARRDFARNLIYPHLSSLVHVHETLKTLLDRFEGVRRGLPKEIVELDLEASEVRYDYALLSSDHIEIVRKLIDWALPRIEAAIEEGRTIFEFVDENLRLGEVGIVPSYVEEGYLMIPNRHAREVHILKYSLSIFTGARERYRSLKTSHIKTVVQPSADLSPQSIKLDLVAEHRDLPNPATYLCDLDIEFPFEQTVVPVAKRKLMRHLYTQTGRA